MKGVKMKIIIDMDSYLIVIPPLHIILALVNIYFIKPKGYSYTSRSNKRIENIPE